jgi:pyruvate kinase
METLQTAPAPDTAAPIPSIFSEFSLGSDACTELIERLWRLRAAMLAAQATLAQPGHATPETSGTALESQRNLVHWLTWSANGGPSLDPLLLSLGLAPLAQSPAHVMASLDKVLGLLHGWTQRPLPQQAHCDAVGRSRAHDLLRANRARLLGPEPVGRALHLGASLLPNHASVPLWPSQLVRAGLDLAGLRCTGPDTGQWLRLATHLRQAAQDAQRPLHLLAELAGTSLHTGAWVAQMPVLKLKPTKDALGRVLHPAQLRLRPFHSSASMPGVDASIGVWEEWLGRLKAGSVIAFEDARGAKRQLRVTQCDALGAVAECSQTAYLTGETVLCLEGGSKRKQYTTLVCQIDGATPSIRLKVGDLLRLVANVAELPAEVGADAESDPAPLEPPQLMFPMPEVMEQAGTGQRVVFDHGRLHGVIVRKDAGLLDVEITHSAEGGERLSGPVPLDLPDTLLHLPVLSSADRAALPQVLEWANLLCAPNLVRPEQVAALRQALAELGHENMPLAIRVADRQAFEHLPDNLLAAMAQSPVLVLVDSERLAMACGIDGLPQVHHHIRQWASAAHAPVAFVSQAMHTLSQTGVPSRAEVAQAGLPLPADAVVLPHGPFLPQAIQALDQSLKESDDPSSAPCWRQRPNRRWVQPR